MIIASHSIRETLNRLKNSFVSGDAPAFIFYPTVKLISGVGIAEGGACIAIFVLKNTNSGGSAGEWRSCDISAGDPIALSRPRITQSSIT